MSDNDHYAVRILNALSTEPDKPALWWRGDVITAGELRTKIESAGRAMLGHGIGARATVAVLTESNSPDMLAARYAANLLGAAVFHLRSTNAVTSRRHISEESQLAMARETGCALIVTDGPNAERARGFVRRLDPAPRLAAFSDLGADIADLSAAVGGDPVDWPPVDPEALAIITYTSGSTGRPKGICRSFRAWRHAVSTTVDMTDEPRMLVTTPLSHTVGPMADAALSTGGMLFLHEDFEPEAVLDAIAEHRITRVFWAAPQIYQVLDHPKLASADTSSLNLILYGGTPAAPDRLAQGLKVFGPVFVQTYGSTETWEIGTMSREDHLDPSLLGTSGRPSPGTRVVVRDPDTDEDLPVGEIGEICLQSPGMLNGYWNDPDLTARALRGGYFHTGDLGRFDERGFIHLVDRLSHVIKYNGVKVYPNAVENALLGHPDVAQAAVYGVVDEDSVEHVHAAIVPKAGSVVTPDALREHVRASLPAEYVPQVITMRDELPFISSGKLDKQRLKAEAQERRG
ncbi:AMP-binding protein [Microbispora triticiradicis]|uniref:AMP-binding protein n=2 Tax=Microbispora TaxID=2005 RepID=A0ABY3LNN0_9ACTN|nr:MULTISPECIES: AMP-binding protein [Microbispora]TLP50906.1 hypothetical protein FED44_34695 [Microbispora fusca]TYB43740.1 AMP-binding protein [Microbispora tritici]